MATKERRAAPRKPKEKPAARERPAEVPSPEDIRRRIEMAAYLKAKARGFQPGYEQQDWLEAEAEVKERLRP